MSMNSFTTFSVSIYMYVAISSDNVNVLRIDVMTTWADHIVYYSLVFISFKCRVASRIFQEGGNCPLNPTKRGHFSLFLLKMGSFNSFLEELICILGAFGPLMSPERGHGHEKCVQCPNAPLWMQPCTHEMKIRKMPTVLIKH